MRMELVKANSFLDYEIFKIPFPVCNLNEDVDEHNIGFTQGIISNNIPFAAEVWKYADEETLVVYIPDLGVVNRNDYVEDIGAVVSDEINELENISKEECYDLSVLNEYMTCRYVEGIYEITTLYKDYLIDMGIIEFCSNIQNACVTYYEDLNGTDIVAISVVIRKAGKQIADYRLPLTPFIRSKCKDIK